MPKIIANVREQLLAEAKRGVTDTRYAITDNYTLQITALVECVFSYARDTVSDRNARKSRAVQKCI